MKTHTHLTLAALFVLAGALAVGCTAGTDSPSTEPEEEVVGEASQASTTGVCWAATTLRGAGTIPSECPNQEKDGALCYPWCAAGYDGVGPVCWEICPSGARDDGAFCRRDAKIISANTSACPWYDVCGVTLAKGCSKCPSGYHNDGCTCRIDAQIWAKKSYGRGAGTPMHCPTTRPVMDGGLCYPACGPNQTGVGPVCWHNCTGSYPVACGLGCATDQPTCNTALADQILSPVELVAEIVLGIVTEDPAVIPEVVATAVTVADAYDAPICPN